MSEFFSPNIGPYLQTDEMKPPQFVKHIDSSTDLHFSVT